MLSGPSHLEHFNLNQNSHPSTTARINLITVSQWPIPRWCRLESKHTHTSQPIVLELTHRFYCREIFPLYRMSYMWYTCYGAVTTMIVALLSTVIFGTNSFDDIDPTLIAPCIRRYLHLDERKPKSSQVFGWSSWHFSNDINQFCLDNHLFYREFQSATWIMASFHNPSQLCEFPFEQWKSINHHEIQNAIEYLFSIKSIFFIYSHSQHLYKEQVWQSSSSDPKTFEFTLNYSTSLTIWKKTRVNDVLKLRTKAK